MYLIIVITKATVREVQQRPTAFDLALPTTLPAEGFAYDCSAFIGIKWLVALVMVPEKGLEPSTFALQERCYYQLSYSGKCWL